MNTPATNEELRDILGPIPLPESQIPWLLAGGILLLLLAGALFFFLRRRKKKEAPSLLAHEIALAELARARKLITAGKGLAYAQRLSALLRQYIESRFRVSSTRQTTAELLKRLQTGDGATEEIMVHLDPLQTCLQQCDLAKFAHLPPDQSAMESMESSVCHFIESTTEQADSGGTP